MKRFILGAMVFISGIALAKKQGVAPSYDHVGRLVSTVNKFEYNSEAHVSTQYGSADAYCNVGTTDVNCTDSPAQVYNHVELEGEDSSRERHALHASHPPAFTTVEGKSGFMGLEPSMCSQPTASNYPFACDPLGLLLAQIKANEQVTFKYRVVTANDTVFHDQRREFYCVPFTLADKKGRSKMGEACYELDIGWSPLDSLRKTNPVNAVSP